MAVEEELAAEVERLAGRRYAHTGSTIKRWGSNNGSVFLGDQRVSVKVPRVRDAVAGREVGLESYQALRDPGVIDNAVLGRVLNGISARKYDKVAMMVGIKKSSVSRRFVKAARNKLGELLERDLSGHDIVVVFIDGKSFAENSMILALGVTMEGDKVVRDFINGCGEGGGLLTDELMEIRVKGVSPRAQALHEVMERKGVNTMVAICAICKAQFTKVLPEYGFDMEVVASLHQLVSDAIILGGKPGV
ncbi:MAG: transposase [Nitrospinota bacterium]|nr:transposase [Nitrospinota bacterium]